jgi:hypothetical protein
MGEGASIAEIEPSIASFAEKRAQQDWKRQVLAREIELEEIDTTPFHDRYGPNSVQITPQAAEWSVVLTQLRRFDRPLRDFCATSN